MEKLGESAAVTDRLQNYSEYRRLPKSGCVVFSADERVAVVRVGDKGFVGAVVIVDHDAVTLLPLRESQ